MMMVDGAKVKTSQHTSITSSATPMGLQLELETDVPYTVSHWCTRVLHLTNAQGYCSGHWQMNPHYALQRCSNGPFEDA